MDECRIDHDCSLGYKCQLEQRQGVLPEHQTGYCVQETCAKDDDCSSGKCQIPVGQTRGTCAVIACDDPPGDRPGLFAYDDFSKHFVPLDQDTVSNKSHCVATSHYHLQGRTSTVDIRKDPRYRGMY